MEFYYTYTNDYNRHILLFYFGVYIYPTYMLLEYETEFVHE